MSDQPQTPGSPGAPEQPEAHTQEPAPPRPEEPAHPQPARRSALAAALPFLATAAAAVLLSLLIQAALWPRQPPAQPEPTAPSAATAAAVAPTPTAEPAASPTPAPAASPAPTSVRGEESVLSLQILDLEDQNQQLWSAIYLLRAASQIDDSITALEGNDVAEADRTLLAVYRSLDRAYTFSAEQEKGPIDTFRLELSRIRDDLRVRPEGADRRLRQLRQLMLSLVDEEG